MSFMRLHLCNLYFASLESPHSVSKLDISSQYGWCLAVFVPLVHATLSQYLVCQHQLALTETHSIVPVCVCCSSSPRGVSTLGNPTPLTHWGYCNWPNSPYQWEEGLCLTPTCHVSAVWIMPTHAILSVSSSQEDNNETRKGRRASLCRALKALPYPVAS